MCEEHAILMGLACYVRSVLAGRYDVSEGGEYAHYRGLSMGAARMFMFIVEDLNYDLPDHMKMRAGIVQGEQNSKLPGSLGIEHTWLEVFMNGETYHVDPTSEQFMKYYEDIPKVYVSTEPPKWYLADRDDPIIQACKAQKTKHFG